jgi:hypothetical protein
MNGFWDRLGISVSLACVLHCLLLPVMILLGPVFGQFFTDPIFHLFIAIIVIPVAIYALASGYRKHRVFNVLILGGLGLAAIGIGLVIEQSHIEIHAAHSSTLSAVAMITAGLTLAAAHLMNLRHCRKCQTPHSSPSVKK